MKNRDVFSDVSTNKKSLFALSPILVNIFACIVIVASYIYISKNMLFADWPLYVWWTTRLLLAYNILTASARSLLAPIITLLTALTCYYVTTVYGLDYIETTDARHLIFISLVGFLVTFLLRY